MGCKEGLIGVAHGTSPDPQALVGEADDDTSSDHDKSRADGEGQEGVPMIHIDVLITTSEILSMAAEGLFAVVAPSHHVASVPSKRSVFRILQ